MSPRAIVLLVAAFFLQTLAAQTSPKATAESVLNKLYLANGNKIYPKPSIEVISDERKAAQYIRRTNTIEVGVKAFEVCRVFGKDSLSALAFIIGHEMAHAFQMNPRQGSFLAYDKENGADIDAEKDADIQGLFNTWLAGYNSMDLLLYIIEGIYVAYDLKGKELPGYPSLEERKQSAREVRLIVTELVRMYETGCYLSVIGQYDLAAACFRYVESRYKGREVYNNIGVNLVLQAINISEKNVDPYIFPLELDFETRLKKPKADRGPGDLTPEQWLQRGTLLARAAEYFAQASKMDDECLPADVNYVCALVLNAKAAEAIEYCERREVVKKSKLLGLSAAEQGKVKLALALAYAYNHRTESFAMFDELKASSDNFVGFTANYNASVLAGKTPVTSSNTPCQIISDTDNLVDEVKVHRPVTGAWAMLDNATQIEVSTVPNKTSDLITFRVNGQNRISLQRIRRELATTGLSLNAVATSRGHLDVCREKQVIVLVDDKSRQVREWVKYYEFK